MLALRPMGLVRSLRESSPRGRLARGVLANVYDKAAVTLVQLLSISVLSRIWGAEAYGVWLMLLTVPTYIALSDLGLGTAAGVRLTQCAALGEYAQASRVFQSTIAFVMATVTLAAAAAVCFAVWYALEGRAVGDLSANEIAVSIGLITVYSVILAQMSIVTVVYRATNKFAFAMTFSGTLILIEGGALASMALFGFRLSEIAFAYMLIRLAGYIGFVLYLKKVEPWVHVGVRDADGATIRELASPSAAALALTFANAVMLQGMTLALGASASPAVVAVFGAARTLSRMPLQLSGLVLRPSIVELTRAMTEGNQALQRRLTRVNVCFAIAATVPFGVTLILVGGALLKYMSGAELEAGPGLFAPLALASAFNAIWTALSAPLVAQNRQGEFSYAYLVLSMLGVGFLLASPWRGAGTAAMLMALIEASLMMVVGLTALRSRRVSQQ